MQYMKGSLAIMKRQLHSTVGALLVALLLMSASLVQAQQLQDTLTAPTIDGDPSDWGAASSLAAYASEINNSVAATVTAQYIYKDALNDDDTTGTGSFVYPTNAEYDGNEIDLDEFRFAYDALNAYFLITVNDSSDGAFGNLGVRTGIYIDRTDMDNGTSTTYDIGGHTNFIQSYDVNMDATFNWEYHLSNRGTGGGNGYVFEYLGQSVSEGSNNAQFPGNLQEAESLTSHALELSIPWGDLGGLPQTGTEIKMVVGIALEDGNDTRETVEFALPFRFGGSSLVGDTNDSNATIDDDPDFIDLAGSTSAAGQTSDFVHSLGSPAVISDSIISITLDTPAEVFPLNDVRMTFDNDFVQILPGEIVTNASLVDTANYIIDNANPNDITVVSAERGTGIFFNDVFLTLSRPITVTDQSSGVELVINDQVVDDDGNETFFNQRNWELSVLNVIPVTYDASIDAAVTDGFLNDFFIRGGWDGFNTRFPMTDGEDPYPDFPGDQSDDTTPGDGIFAGRVFTSASTSNVQFVFNSEFDFGDLAQPGKTQARLFGPGYFGRNFNTLNNGGPINLTKEFENRLLANEVTANFRVLVPTSEFNSTQAQQIDVYIQAGPTFGGEGALVTSPSSVMPGEADVTDGLLLTFQGEESGNNVFTGIARFPAGIPDVGTFRLGYDASAFSLGIFREEENALNDPSAVGQNPADVSGETIHPHVARVASNDGSRATGRTIEMTFNVVSIDVGAAPSDGLISGSEAWTNFE
jgi:hypothetical protein